MKARHLLPIPLLALLATFAPAFAPAPVYKEPPKPPSSSFLRAMQGTWGRSLSSRARGPRGARVRVDGDAWTVLSPGPRGADGGRVGTVYTLHLDTSRDPIALDLVHQSTSRVRMRGIIKLEGERLIFCFTTSPREEDRPRSFADTETADGAPVRTMRLTLVESHPNVP